MKELYRVEKKKNKTMTTASDHERFRYPPVGQQLTNNQRVSIERVML